MKNDVEEVICVRWKAESVGDLGGEQGGLYMRKWITFVRHIYEE